MGKRGTSTSITLPSQFVINNGLKPTDPIDIYTGADETELILKPGKKNRRNIK